MPRYACHHAIRLLTPSKIRTLDTHHAFRTTYLTTTHRVWDPEYPTFISTTHTHGECYDGLSCHNREVCDEEREQWRERLVGKRLVGKNSKMDDSTTFNVQSLPSGQDPAGPSCTRILGPLKCGFNDVVESRLTVRVDGDDVVWDVYFG